MKPALIRLNIAVFLWGFTGVLGRAINLNEGWIVWWRLLLTVISMWLFFFFLKKIEKIKLKSFLAVGGIGVLLALHWLCFYGSIKYSNVSIALTCLSSSAFISAILEPLFFRKKISSRELLYGALTIIGIGLVYIGNVHFTVGIYIGLMAMLLNVLVSVFSKKIVDDYKPETFVLYELTGGLIGLSLLMPFYNHLFPVANIFPQKFDWLWLMILAWLCTIFTFVLYTQSLKFVSAFTANITLTLEPVYGIILAFILYKENKDLSSIFYIGFLCILLAVILQTRTITRKPKDKMIQE
ncbi:hypothetical protein A9P82_00995 [Arachidicoccus ginsenosidimutans]|uniref:DMT family transporter n=1 Tax=Arachidicoccus sp. BS20 TaxID=1850526 RepID=UPI0007F12D16|nr:EamA family transporter [Arachidicoccus sp. BS20]ANI88020.1 hypothetical protein A9P82_00995 [Arachidicoccus sp. BS20]